ncbi:unnamed protein product [Rhizoctonia solani]|uniref:Protein kinase domain-containing protein n=1 Tax=Rhizoctonia solani TaxID=456999 RepID=A0A8H3E2I9_9AGAM|nr:unnamed protein product [Rhizoctonia solani]
MRNGQLVAIKCIEMFGNWGTWRPHGKHWKHAAHELYAWSKCDHPGVLKALGFALIEGFILLVSPWMRNGPLSNYSCLEIAHTLEYIHHKGIVHGDLKAENVLVSDTGHTQLVDFGSATLTNYLSLCFTQTSRTHGLSLRFAAPEILDGEPHTIESDVYALGMQILTGELPYAGMSDQAAVASVFRQLNPPRPVFNGVISNQRANDKLWGLLLRCWNHDPESRPTAAEVLIEIAE